MKTIIIFFIVAFMAFPAFAQDSTINNFSKTRLCDAKKEVIDQLLIEGFDGKTTLDIENRYIDLITPKVIECIRMDIVGWGMSVKTDAHAGEFRRHRLQFSDDSYWQRMWGCKCDNGHKFDKSIAKKYKKSIKKIKKQFFDDRKKLTPEQIVDENKNLKKLLKPLKKKLRKDFRKDLKKVRK